MAGLGTFEVGHEREKRQKREERMTRKERVATRGIDETIRLVQGQKGSGNPTKSNMEIPAKSKGKKGKKGSKATRMSEIL